MGTKVSVARIGMDIQRNFSQVTARDAQQHVVWRQRLEHRARDALRRQLARWPTQTPVVLEGSFGWSWLADELATAGLPPHLASSRKVAQGRERFAGARIPSRTQLLSLVRESLLAPSFAGILSCAGQGTGTSVATARIRGKDSRARACEKGFSRERVARREAAAAPA